MRRVTAISLQPEFYKVVRREAERRELNLSELIRQALREYLGITEEVQKDDSR